MIDLSQAPMGSAHVFERAGTERMMKRVPGGWNWGGFFLDDGEVAGNGWHWVREDG